MELIYTVSKEKGGLWYAHRVGFTHIPCMISERNTFGDKKNAEYISNLAKAYGAAIQRIYGFTS